MISYVIVSVLLYIIFIVKPQIIWSFLSEYLSSTKNFPPLSLEFIINSASEEELFFLFV